MSGGRRSAVPTVIREYRPEEDACTRALAALLRTSAHKKSAEPHPGPDTRNTRGESDGSRATRVIQD